MALIVTKDKSKESTNILKPKHKLQNSRFETMEANHETAISNHEIMINLNCLMTVLGYCSKSSAGITPAAKRNTYIVATFSLFVPRVEALRTSTLGYYTNKSCYSVRVAISRRCYSQQE